jgi:hypothetical protein
MLLLHLSAFTLLFTPALSKCVNLTAAAVTALFQHKLSPGAGIFFPSDANYSTEVVQRATIFASPTYFAALKPAVASDVQTIVSHWYYYGFLE